MIEVYFFNLKVIFPEKVVKVLGCIADLMTEVHLDKLIELEFKLSHYRLLDNVIGIPSGLLLEHPVWER